MAESEFWAKYRDPRWQKKRLEILERDEWKCRDCNKSDSQLQVHHGFYERGKDPWDYPKWSLRTVCENCHNWRRETQTAILAALSAMDWHEVQEVLGYALVKSKLKAGHLRLSDLSIKLGALHALSWADRRFGEASRKTDEPTIAEFKAAMQAVKDEITIEQDAEAATWYETFELSEMLLAEV